MLVRDVMHTNPMTIGPETTLDQAFALMRERRIRHLPVVSAGNLAGVVTDRDLRLATSRLAAHQFAPGAAVADVMSRQVQTAHPLDPIEVAARTMRELKIGCLPVLDGREMVGIVTGIDILDALLRLTGVERPSGRLELVLTDRPGELVRLIELISKHGVNIHSILSYPEGEHRGRIVLRVGTMEIRTLLAELHAGGFEVLWPHDKPWPT